MNIPGFAPSVSTSGEAITGAAALLGVTFPAAYREVLAEFSGAYGDAEFPMPGSEHPGSIGHWLSIDPWQRNSLWSVVSSWPEHGLPRTVVPVAATGSGNYLCLDYRVMREPSIAFWWHELPDEQGLDKVASSFSEFLVSLREPGA